MIIGIKILDLPSFGLLKKKKLDFGLSGLALFWEGGGELVVCRFK